MTSGHHVHDGAHDGFRAPDEWRRRSDVEHGCVGGWTVWSVESTGSTNADLIAAAQSGAPDRSVLVAGHQTAGRGRLDRRWDAPPGVNLLASLLLRSEPAARDATRRLALAAVGAVAPLASGEVTLKWPNDVLIDERKLAGILAERHGDATVAGIGLNLGWAPPEGARLGDEFDAFGVLGRLLTAFAELPDDIATTYRHGLATLGRTVRVETFGDAIEGIAIDVDDDGRLLVLDRCAVTHRLDVGDVVHLRGE